MRFWTLPITTGPYSSFSASFSADSRPSRRTQTKRFNTSRTAGWEKTRSSNSAFASHQTPGTCSTLGDANDSRIGRPTRPA